MFIQRLHEAEAALQEALKEKEALLAENVLLKVELENLKKASEKPPVRRTNPFAVEKKTNPFAAEKPKKTNPFAAEKKTNPFVIEEEKAKKTNPFALAEAGKWDDAVPATESWQTTDQTAEQTTEQITDQTTEQTTEPVTEQTTEQITEQTAEKTESSHHPHPLLHRAPRVPRAPRASRAVKAKSAPKRDAWELPAEEETSLKQQYATLCDGDNGVNITTLQEEFENLGLDEATGNDM